VDSLHSSRSGRLLTLHLEKSEPTIWPSLIIGPVPVSLVPAPSAPPGSADDDDFEFKYNMDSTSLGLLGIDFFDIRKDREGAFEFFIRAWHQARSPLSAWKLVTHYLPLQTTLPPISDDPQIGTTGYYVKRIGGQEGLARLFLEAGLKLHLEGAASLLLTSSSALSSIRTAGPYAHYPGETGTEAWRRDKEAARRYFDRARALDPSLEVPTLVVDAEGTESISGTVHDLKMPSLPLGGSAVASQASRTSRRSKVREVTKPRRRREKEETPYLDQRSTEDDMDATWYLYLPGLLGAGTALLAVAVIGAVSVSSWRKSQS